MPVLRIQHQKNYVVLQKEVLENENLSLKAKGLWAYCMAKPDSWEFHITQLATVLKEGKKALYNAIQELIAEGYCTKSQTKGEKGRWISVDYTILEVRQTEPPRLKECLPQSHLGEADSHRETPHRPFRRADKEPLLSNDLKQVKKEEVIPPPPEAVEITNYFLKKILESKPDFKLPKIEKWAEEIERMLRIDKRESHKILAVIEWVTQDSFWKANVLSAESLRKHFDKLEFHMSANKVNDFKRDNLKIFSQTIQSYPILKSQFKVAGNYVIQINTAKELNLSMQPRAFGEAFAHMVGGTLED